jgi:hypothetical protein
MTTKLFGSSATSSAAGTMVVARLLNGRKIKGTGKAVEVEVADLKALFFVNSYEGDPGHRDDYDFDKVRGHGRKAVITFVDGETMAGYTMGYHPEKPGFFLIPADRDGNNSRVFVVNSAVKKFENA